MNLTNLMYMLLHSSDYILEFAVGVLFLSTCRKQTDRARFFIGMFLMLSIAVSIANISYFIDTRTEKGAEVISMTSTVLSFPVFFFLLLYLVECYRPNEYDIKKTFKLLTPWLCVAIPTIILCCFGEETHLYNTSEIYQNLDKPDVILRIISVLIYLPYGVWCIVLSKKWDNGLNIRPLAKIMCWCTALMTVTFVGGHGFNNLFFDVSHVVLYVIITLLPVYAEFAHRFLPNEKSPEVSFLKIETETQPTTSHTASRLKELLETNALWKNPELMQSDLVRALGTNTKYVQNAIRELGYASYPDIINNYRVNFVTKALDQDPRQNLKVLFYEAGFRSRITAWRSFTKIVGCSPKDYCDKKANQEV